VFLGRRQVFKQRVCDLHIRNFKSCVVFLQQFFLLSPKWPSFYSFFSAVWKLFTKKRCRLCSHEKNEFSVVVVQQLFTWPKFLYNNFWGSFFHVNNAVHGQPLVVHRWCSLKFSFLQRWTVPKFWTNFFEVKCDNVQLTIGFKAFVIKKCLIIFFVLINY
jgi:hypothetical protein